MNKVDISTTQIIDFPENSQMDSLMLSEINPITTTPIKDICFLEDPNLYSWPWNNFSKFFKDLNTSAEFCANTTNSFNYPWTRPWTRKFDDQQNPQSKTPWLYKAVTVSSNVIEQEPYYLYVSYEDISSLYSKLEYVMNEQIGGISISDVNYDDDENNLLNYIQVIRGESPPLKNGPDELPPTNNTQGNDGKSPTSNENNPKKSDETNPIDKPKPKKAGIIAGSIIGILAFVLLIGAFGYRLRKHRLKSEAGDFKPKGSILTHITSKNEMSSEPSPRLVSPTTVIPAVSGHVTAMFDFTGQEENDLSFKKGDVIEVLEKGDGPNDWWIGRINGVVGEFPGKF